MAKEKFIARRVVDRISEDEAQKIVRDLRRWLKSKDDFRFNEIDFHEGVEASNEMPLGFGRIFIVMQGSNYDIESRGKFLWAPDDNIRHHNLLKTLQPGDIVISYVHQEIKSINVVLEKPVIATAPKGHTGSGIGIYVKCYYDLEKPSIDTKAKNREKIMYGSGYKYSPFNKLGNGNMGYLYKLPRILLISFYI